MLEGLPVRRCEFVGSDEDCHIQIDRFEETFTRLNIHLHASRYMTR